MAKAKRVCAACGAEYQYRGREINEATSSLDAAREARGERGLLRPLVLVCCKGCGEDWLHAHAPKTWRTAEGEAP